MTDAKTIIKDWCAAAGMPEPSDGECHALEVALQQPSGNSGELPSAQDREDAQRYRWLRDPCSGAEHIIFYSRGDYGKGLMSGEMLDAAIDAARAAKGE